MKLKKILLFIDYYLPGYCAGGPIISITNMINFLRGEIEFYIVTSDRDLGSKNSYEGIVSDAWQGMAGANVLYLTNRRLSTNIFKIIKSNNWDEIYLNSFFSTRSIKVVVLKKILKFNLPILLAPRGEFSKGALAIKSLKKKLYIFLAKFFGLYRGVIWHVTDNEELVNVQKIFGEKIVYKIAHDPVFYEKYYFHPYIEKEKNLCRIVFISRIARNKNLHICLEILNKIMIQAEIVFDVYGPIENQSYWQQCKALIREAPNNIKISYRGQIPHEAVFATIAKYHVFFLPTAGENFGHAIFESFMTGRPVLIGNDTPWKNLKVQNIGADIDPKNQAAFIEEISRYMAMGQKEFDAIVASCHQFAMSVANSETQKAEQRALFL